MNEKWSYKQSVVLTKICILLFSAAYFGVIFTCPLLTRRFLYYSCSAAGVYKETWLFNVTIYACAVPIGVLLWNLWKLVGDIGLEEIFTGENIRRLRIISWMCFAVAFICLLSMAYDFFWGIFAACMVFIGMLIRVIKNTFERARELKEEVDYTI